MKLTKISNWVWLFFILILAFSSLIIFFILFYKIEKTANVDIMVDENKKYYLVIQNTDAYYLKNGQVLSLNINQKNFEISLLTSKYKNDKVIYNFVTNNFDLKEKLKPNVIIKGKIIFGKTTFFNKLFLT